MNIKQRRHLDWPKSTPLAYTEARRSRRDLAPRWASDLPHTTNRTSSLERGWWATRSHRRTRPSLARGFHLVVAFPMEFPPWSCRLGKYSLLVEETESVFPLKTRNSGLDKRACRGNSKLESFWIRMRNPLWMCVPRAAMMNSRPKICQRFHLWRPTLVEADGISTCCFAWPKNTTATRSDRLPLGTW